MEVGRQAEGMEAFLGAVVSIAVPLFAISSMASVGVGHDLREVTRPFRRPLMLVTAILANFVAMPLLSVLLIRAFNLPLPQATGLFLVASAGGAAFLLALVRIARGDVAQAGGHLLILTPFTILFLPIVIPIAIPDATVQVVDIAVSLTLTMLLPLALGVVFRKKLRHLVPKLMPKLGRTSQISLVVLLAAILLNNLPAVGSLLGTSAIPAAALLILGGLIIGYVGSVPSKNSRVVLSLATGQRNIAAAMIVAATGFETREPLVMVVVTSLVAFVVLFPAAYFFRRVLGRHAARERVRFKSRDVGPYPFDRRRRV